MPGVGASNLYSFRPMTGAAVSHTRPRIEARGGTRLSIRYVTYRYVRMKKRKRSGLNIRRMMLRTEEL